MPEVDEIADGIHRIATFVPEEGLTFNQFLIAGDEPLLFHTGPRAMFQETLDGIARIMDPTRLRWVSWSHFEADECGALNDFLELAPNAEPVHSGLGAGLNGSDFAIRPVHIVADGEVLDLGGHRLRILVTPHVPHGWDAITAHDESTGTLFVSDLLAHGGPCAAATDHDVVGPALDVLRVYPEVIPLSGRTFSILDRMAGLAPSTLAIHHGAAYTGDATKVLTEFRAELATRARSELEAALATS
jgi:flavorubredoxin